MNFFYYESDGVQGVARNSDTCRIEVRGTIIPIDYNTYKEGKADIGKFKDKFEIKEERIKGKLTKVVERKKDVPKDSQPIQPDNPI